MVSYDIVTGIKWVRWTVLLGSGDIHDSSDFYRMRVHNDKAASSIAGMGLQPD